MHTYFFRHHSKCEGMLGMAESCGMLSMSKRSTANLLYGSTGTDISYRGIQAYPSQVGMAYTESVSGFPSPRPMRNVFQPNPQPRNEYSKSDMHDDSYSFCYGALQY